MQPRGQTANRCSASRDPAGTRNRSPPTDMNPAFAQMALEGAFSTDGNAWTYPARALARRPRQHQSRTCRSKAPPLELREHVPTCFPHGLTAPIPGPVAHPTGGFRTRRGHDHEESRNAILIGPAVTLVARTDLLQRFRPTARCIIIRASPRSRCKSGRSLPIRSYATAASLMSRQGTPMDLAPVTAPYTRGGLGQERGQPRTQDFLVRSQPHCDPELQAPTVVGSQNPSLQRGLESALLPCAFRLAVGG